MKGKNSVSKDFVVTTARNLEEISAIRTIWEEFQSRPNSDIDHYLHVVREDQNVIRPHVTLLLRSGKPVALSVGRIENHTFACKFGYKTIYAPRIKALTIVYDGLLGDFSIENSEIMLDSLRQIMWLEKLDVLRFPYLRMDSPMYELVRKVPNILARDYLRSPSLHWRMDVPESMDGYFRARSRNFRHVMRRIRQALEKEFSGQVHFRIYTDEQQLDELIRDGEIVAKKTYQRGLGQGFNDRPEMKKLLRSLIERNQFRAYILYIRGEPCAFWTGRSYRNAFYLMHTGYDPGFKDYGVGTALFMHMLQDLTENTNIDHIDFGFSDQIYKARFGTECWKEETIYLFSSGWGGLRLNAIRSFTGMSWIYTIGMLTKLGIKNKIKRMIRGWLTRG
jgi:hypothetical protein